MMTIQGAMEGFVARKCEEISITPCLTGEEQIEMHAQLDVAKQSMNEAMTKSSDLKVIDSTTHSYWMVGNALLSTWCSSEIWSLLTLNLPNFMLRWRS